MFQAFHGSNESNRHYVINESACDLQSFNIKSEDLQLINLEGNTENPSTLLRLDLPIKYL